MRLAGEKLNRIKKIGVFSLVFILIISFFLIPLSTIFLNFYYKNPTKQSEFIHSSAETVYNQEWLKNNNFSTQDAWYYTKGAQGDNSTVDANISNNQGNFRVLGENRTFELSGIPNSIDSPDWYEFEKSINSSYLPDFTGIDSDGCWVSHTWSEGANQFPGVHWRKNVSMPVDMSEYTITSASIEVIFNATVDDDVDVLGESAVDQFATGDYVKFYVYISDVEYKNSFPVALNKTRDLGYDGHGLKSTITDKSIESYDENVLITALESAFEKDPSHSNFTITLGIDIYSEDNWGSDIDTFDDLRIKSCNLTFSYEKKIDQFSSVSWNQKGNEIASDKQVTNANLKFNYKIDQDWPTTVSPFSEIRILINNNPHAETVRLSSANSTLQEAKIGGFDVTNLILKDVNITLSIQVFIANTFDFDTNITVSIDDVYLNITYKETFADFGTESQLFLETFNKTLDPFIQIPFGNTVNITIKYLDNQTGNHISGANVQVSGKVSGQLNESGSFEQYSRIINSSDLELGIWSLTVTAQKSNYVTQTISFFVDVVERPTDLQLYVNNTLKTYNNTMNIKSNEVMNITVYYRDNLTNQHLSGANVTITNFGDLTENGEHYTIVINSNLLNLGFNVLSINAQSENYASKMIQLYVEVFERATEFELYVNGDKKLINDKIQTEVNQILNLTVFYRDDISKAHLSGAEVTLLTVGNFSETGTQYNYTLNTNDLDQGITIVIIEAQFNNYQSQSFQFFIEVSERASEISLFLNSEEKTSDPVYELPLGSSLNVTVKYSDNQTKTHITGGIIQLIDDTYSDNLTENLAMNQYTLLLDTTVLKIGVNLFTIIAYANNFQVKTLSLRITLNRIATVINTTSGDSYFSRSHSQSLSLSIILTDSDFGGTITNATVTYRWAYGQGTLLDPENDGTYEVELENIPTGIYTISITASAGDDYNFETFQITLNVVSVTPPDFSLLFITLAGALVVLVVGFSLYEVRFKYPALVRKSRKIRKKIRKDKKTKPVKDIISREDLIKDHLENNVEIFQLEKKPENGLKEK